WITARAGEVTARSFAGAVDPRDLDEAARRRRALLAELGARMGLAHLPKVEIVFSPSRRAAAQHRLAAGRAFAAAGRAEVIWPGAPDAYEARRPGHELAHLLAAYWDGAPAHLPLVEEGLAEVLDASGRDLHHAYAAARWADGAGGDPVAFTTDDLSGSDYGRAGSFVRSLVDRHGLTGLRALWPHLAVRYGGGRMWGADGTQIGSVAALEGFLDRALRAALGGDLATERAAWARALRPYLEAPEASLPDGDLVEIQRVIAAYDRAVTDGDIEGARAALDGFYCDVWDDGDRAALLSREVQRLEDAETKVLAVRRRGLRNYPEVVVHGVRRETMGGRSAYRAVTMWLEHFPVGWRLTGSTAWTP
ncbi:MAG: hypothetical protein D6729_08485, partial [Deltaproteobacteria bacterium]